MSGLVYVGGYGPDIVIFERDGARLTRVGGVPASDASYLALDGTGSHLYAVNELHANSVTAYEVAGTGLRELGSQPTGGTLPCHVAVHPAGYVLCANYGSGSVSVHPVLPDGGLGARTDLAQHEGSGPNPERQEGPHAHQVYLHGSHIVAVDLGLDRLIGYRLDARTGRLEVTHDPFARTQPGAGPRHTVRHPSGRWYVADELDSTVTVFDPDPTTGVLHEVACLPSTLSDVDGENLPAGIAVSADGTRLYVSNRGHDTVVTYAVGEQGDLTALDEVSTGGDWPRHFAISQGVMFVANQRSDSVTVFAMDEGTGVPRPTGETIEVPAPTCVLPTPSSSVDQRASTR